MDPQEGLEERLSAGERAFERWRQRLGVLLTPVAFAVVYWAGAGLTPAGRKLAAILAAVGVLWMSEVIPLPVSALVGAVLCVVLGVEEAKSVLAYFADPIVFVFIGGFMIARAMSLHQLDRRLALAFLSIPWVGERPARVLAGFGLVTALLSMWVSNSATTAMMLPIAFGILSALHEARVAKGLARGRLDTTGWPYATAMMLMVAYGASIGGIATPVGSPPNLIGIGLIRTAVDFEISFLRWMMIAIPLLPAMGLALFVLLYALHGGKDGFRSAGAVRPDRRAPAPTGVGTAGGDHFAAFLRSERHKLGRWTRGQINTLVGFGVAVVLWVTPGVLDLPWFEGNRLGPWMDRHLPESIVALVGAIVLFVLPVDLARGRFTLTWREAQAIDWGTILLFGGGLALGSLMFKTGVAEAIGHGLAGLLGVRSLWLLTALSIFLAIVLSETASNTASANMVIPVVIAIAQAAEVSPVPPALGACFGASFGFMLPVSTPPNAIVYGSGLVPLTRMLRAGIVFDIVGFFIILGGLMVLCPLVGLL